MYARDWYRTRVDVTDAYCRLCHWSGDVEGVHDRWDRTITWDCPRPGCMHEEVEELKSDRDD